MRLYFGFPFALVALHAVTDGCSGDKFEVAPAADAESETSTDDSGFDAETGMNDVFTVDGETGTDGPVPDAGPPNVTFDMIAMPCYKAVVIDDVSKKVVWGSGSSATCPTWWLV